MIIQCVSFSWNLTVLALATALGLTPAPQGSLPLGGHSPRTPSIHPYVFEGAVAFNREAATGTLPPAQLDLLVGCDPDPIVIGWRPGPFPKWDPFRNVILASKPIPGGYELHAIDALGNDNLFPAGGGTPAFSSGGIAPVGDGRIYLLAASGFLTCFDANDVWHFVLAPSGQPYVFPDGVVTDCVYDTTSNALIVLQSSSGTGGSCTPAQHANAVVTKIQLSSTGFAVVAPLTRLAFCSGLEDTYISRIARHPDGRLLLRVWAGYGADVVVYALNTLTLTTSWFCTQQSGPGSAWTSVYGRQESVYSNAEAALLGVTQNSPCGPGCTIIYTLRSYPEGSVGPGAPLCSWQGEYRAQFVDLQRP